MKERNERPEWKDAPDWAMYTAMDRDGEWYWYENEPIPRDDFWEVSEGKCRMAYEPSHWTETLESRPEADPKNKSGVVIPPPPPPITVRGVPLC